MNDESEIRTFRKLINDLVIIPFVSGSELLVTGRSAGFDAEEGGTNVTGAIDEVLNGDDDALLLEGIETSFAAGTNIEADIG